MKFIVWGGALILITGFALAALWISSLALNAYTQAQIKIERAPSVSVDRYLPGLDTAPTVAPGDVGIMGDVNSGGVEEVPCPGPNPCRGTIDEDGRFWLCWDDAAGGFRCRNGKGEEQVTE